MTAAREAILGRLRSRNPPHPLPAPWEAGRQADDLVQAFGSALAANKGEITVVQSLAEALDALGDLLEGLKATRIVVNGDAPVSASALAGRWPEREWLAVADASEIKTACASADVGLSGASAALAATGTVIVESGPGKSRAATLLPPVHIVLLPQSALLPDIHAWMARDVHLVPSMATLVSGPSKTADIEQVMAVGVHGPCRLIVILYRE